MKKLLAVVLALALFSSFAVCAFAAESPSTTPTDSTTPAAFPAQPADDEEESGLEIRLLEDDSLVKKIPDEDVLKVDVANADTLEDEADKEAFLAAYEAAKAVEGKAVKYFFWLGIPDELKEGEYAKYDFICTGENVEVTVNGNPMEVVAGEEEDSYTAKLTELGAVAILCDAE